jgi:hypothetical protein
MLLLSTPAKDSRLTGEQSAPCRALSLTTGSVVLVGMCDVPPLCGCRGVCDARGPALRMPLPEAAAAAPQLTASLPIVCRDCGCQWLVTLLLLCMPMLALLIWLVRPAMAE